MTVRDVVAALEAAYPPALAESWDAVGLVCGDPDEPVRRADTFPGLTPDHLRVAVRPPEVAAVLVAALRTALAEVPV